MFGFLYSLANKKSRKEWFTFRLKSVPNIPVNTADFMRKMRFQFSIVYDFFGMRVYITIPKREKDYFESVLKSIPGLELVQADFETGKLDNLFFMTVFPSERESFVTDPFSRDKLPMYDETKPVVSDFFTAFRNRHCAMIVSFIPAPRGELEAEREEYEKVLSKEQTMTTSHGDSYRTETAGHRNASFYTTQRSVKDTDETQIAAEIVSMCNNAKNLNDSVFRVSVIGFGNDALHLETHLESKLLFSRQSIEWNKEMASGIPQEKPEGEIMSGKYASKIVCFARECAEENIVVRLNPLSPTHLGDGLFIGKELVDGLSEGKDVHIDLTSLNRHTLISGQQGVGKTTTGLDICAYALRNKKPVIVITPSKEWSRLGNASKDILIVDVASTPMNLMRCPDDVPVDVFYQNLALHMSNTMGAGPYTNPLRRVMLNSFRELYTNNREPMLSEVYKAIKKSVDTMHGKATAFGINYDKYGQNLTASLENIRELIGYKNFTTDGLRVEDCIERGAVLSLSGVSKLLRPMLYSLFLTHIFSYAPEKFDEKGESELRLLLVLEEAQMVFRKQAYDEGSREVIEELENELGTFRKHGIGLMLITHFADHLSEGIWRQVQNHFVFKQDAKGAKLSIEQLAFNISRTEQVTAARARISTLEQGAACCLLTDRNRRTIGPFFMKLKPEALEPLGDDEISGRMNAYLAGLPPRKAREVPLEKEPCIESRPMYVMNSPPHKALLKAVGKRTHTMASDFIKLDGVKANYKSVLNDLIRAGLVMQETGNGRAIVYRLTDDGAELFTKLSGKEPMKAKRKMDGSLLHQKRVKEFLDDHNDWKVRENTVALTLADREKNGVIDAVLTKGNEVIVYEYETGSNNSDGLFTNFFKMRRKKKEMEKLGCAVKCIWETENKETKERLVELMSTYKQKTGEDIGMWIGTVRERKDNAMKEV